MIVGGCIGPFKRPLCLQIAIKVPSRIELAHGYCDVMNRRRRTQLRRGLECSRPHRKNEVLKDHWQVSKCCLSLVLASILLQRD